MTSSISKVMLRHLDQLKKEMNAYIVEDDIWIKTMDIPNSAGNLCLHICGNLQHFIGAILGNSGYVRQRDDEFSLQDVPLKELLLEIDVTRDVVKRTLEALPEESVKNNYPLEVFGEPMTTEYFLVHLTSHLSYHLGQVNYHRRLLSVED